MTAPKEFPRVPPRTLPQLANGFINAIGTDIPEFLALINEVKTAFSATDQATIDAALADADAAADAQHAKAQGEA